MILLYIQFESLLRRSFSTYLRPSSLPSSSTRDNFPLSPLNEAGEDTTLPPNAAITSPEPHSESLLEEPAAQPMSIDLDDVLEHPSSNPMILPIQTLMLDHPSLPALAPMAILPHADISKVLIVGMLFLSVLYEKQAS